MGHIYSILPYADSRGQCKVVMQGINSCIETILCRDLKILNFLLESPTSEACSLQKTQVAQLGTPCGEPHADIPRFCLSTSAFPGCSTGCSGLCWKIAISC